MATKSNAIRRATKVAYDRGLRVRFGFDGGVFAIDDNRVIRFKSDSAGNWVEDQAAIGTEAPDVLRKLPTPEPENQEDS